MLTQQTPEPFLLGNIYRTQAGDYVRFVKVHNEGTSYETMEDENGVNRYTHASRGSDIGRVTGSAHDYSEPRNTPPLYPAPTMTASDEVRIRRGLENAVAALAAITSSSSRAMQRALDSLTPPPPVPEPQEDLEDDGGEEGEPDTV
jgi:hypothetical protein